MNENTNLETMTSEEIRAELARLANENAALKNKINGKKNNGLKVSAKGGVSVYGLGRWPVTLYRSQWETLLSMADEIKEFIQANESTLASKTEEKA